MTTESTRHTSGGMQTRLVNTAADVISRAMQQGRTLPAALAVALDSAQLLQSPDTAAELEKLRRCHDEDGKALKAAMRQDRESRARITELEADREANDREYEQATARIAELEASPVGGGYPPALPWARLMDREDLAEFLLELGQAAVDHDDVVQALGAVESAIATWRLIGEAQHAHNTAPGPDAETGGAK